MVAAFATLFSPIPAWSAQVTALAALHHDGQTFLTWTRPPGPGWTFRVYRSSSAIRSAADLASAALLGKAADSSWCDRRLSSLSGTCYGFAVDSQAAPLDSTQGLFVSTPEAAGLSWYAVTCQATGEGEDPVLTAGGNSLALPVAEVPAMPRPVFQRTLIGPYGLPADVYTLWTSDRDSPFAPAMCNRPSRPFDCSVHHGLAGGGLLFIAHVRGGSFYLAQAGTGVPGEWQITMDDFVDTPDANTFWFGYHEGYDIDSDPFQNPPTTGTVADHTARRAAFTLEWARRTFPVDTSRVYVTGGSMGGIAGVFLAMWRPDLIAAAMATVPLFDFSFCSDPNPNCAFNERGSQRLTCDRLWGRVASGLMMEDGDHVLTPVYERLNAGAMARSLEARHVPPIIAFSGKRDSLIGWAEKIPFYRAMRESRAGGMFFWDMRGHGGAPTIGAWWPMENFRYVHRFRTDLSFPALSNCSADGDPGDGHASSGDSIGTINGFVEWDDPLVDEPGRWRVRLTLRDLVSLWGTVRAPDSLTVDVTPRRLQRFEVAAEAGYTWRVTRSSDGATIQWDAAFADGLGVLTIPAVKIHRGGSLLELQPLHVLDSSQEPTPPSLTRPRIGPLPCPLRGACTFSVDWPRAGDASVGVFDLAGRGVRALFSGHVEPGRRQQQLDPGGLASGVYFVFARGGGEAAVRRIMVLR